jgi:hypothetical protein
MRETRLGKKYFQVKAHAKAVTNNSKFSSIRFTEAVQIDELIIIVFTAGYKIKFFFKVPWKDAIRLIQPRKKRNVINWSSLKRNNYSIPIDRLPKQDIIAFFKK